MGKNMAVFLHETSDETICCACYWYMEKHDLSEAIEGFIPRAVEDVAHLRFESKLAEAERVVASLALESNPAVDEGDASWSEC